MLLAIVHDYEGLVDAIRARAEQVDISRLTLDQAAGLTDGHAGKLLGAKSIKGFGLRSLGPILQTLGLRIAVLEDPATREKITNKLPRRQSANVRSGSDHWRSKDPERVCQSADDPVGDHLALAGCLGGLARREKLTPEQRKASARKASLARQKNRNQETQ